MNLPAEQRREWIKSRREQRKLMRRARFRRQMLRYTLLVLLTFAGASVFHYLPWSLVNAKQQIIVQGNTVVPDQQVRATLKWALNKPIYTLDPRRLESDLTELDAIQQAFVRRYCLPTPKLVVEVMEEFPWARYANELSEEPQWVIAESGRKISISKFPHIFKPTLKIYGSGWMQFTSKKVSQWATWLAYIEKQTHLQVESVDMRNPQDVRVQAGDLNLKLGNPDASLTRRLMRLASVLRIVEPLRERLEFIDLGLDNNIPLKLAKKTEAQHSL